MAAFGCIFHRTLSRSTSGPNKRASSSSPAICRNFLYVVDVQRYTRDQGSSVYFPQVVLSGDDLYDLTLTDQDCRLRVTLDPGLNRLVERNVLRVGSMLQNATFIPAMAAHLPDCPSFTLLRVEVTTGKPEEEEVLQRLNVASLPWFRSSKPGVAIPLRASRSVFLPLWNNVDYSGELWKETLPPEEEGEGEEEGQRPTVTVSELRHSFLSGRGGIARGTVKHQLIIRIMNKSHLMYYGRTDQNSTCPYKAQLEVCDCTGRVCVVLWNSVCVKWYRRLKPGDIIRLRCYRVKWQYQAEPEDIEISVNSRNPAARISVLAPTSVSPAHLPPPPTYSFNNSKELHDCPHGVVCDVIGLLTFSGRAERIRSKDGRGAELLQYRWLRLEDGASNQPIMVKLFSTSQPETHHKLHPMSVVVCCRLKLIKAADWTDACFYMTNTTYTQVYCTGLGHHSEMSYRKLRPVRQFLQWLRSQDDEQVLGRALIGGFFIYPPPPVSLETHMKNRRGEPGFLMGAELQREIDGLCYRERRTFCIQATVTMVAYSHRGEEDHSLFWTDRSSSLPSSSPSSSSSSSRLLTPACHSPASRSTPSSTCSLHPLPSTPCSIRASPSSSSSAVSQVTPRLLDHRTRKSRKRKQLLTDTPRKRYPSVTLQPDHNSSVSAGIFFEASMEFLQNSSPSEDEESDEEEASSFVTAPPIPIFPSVAMETLPLLHDHTQRLEQAKVVAMGGRPSRKFDSPFEDYYTLRLRALSDSVLVDVNFLPHLSPFHRHSNTWTSILSHGAFSSHTPPPSPADLISMAPQLANQRLVCVLEACHLGGATTELILSRAFHLSD